MNNIICFGDCNVVINIPVREIPPDGGISYSSELDTGAGGRGLNTAVAMNCLGLDPALISQIGKDSFGKIIYDFIKQHGMTTKHIKESEFPTGMVIGLITPNGERRLISVRGDAADIHIAEYDTGVINSNTSLYISGVLLAEGKESRETAINMAHLVKRKGGMVFLDPNLHFPVWLIEDEVKAAFERIFSSVDVLISIEKELILLGGSPNVHESARSVLSKGVGSIWVKLGKRGCAYYTKNSSIAFPPYKAKVTEPGGTGDAFNAAIVFGVVNRFSAEETGTFANLFASRFAFRYGKIQVMPDNTAVENMIKEVFGKKLF